LDTLRREGVYDANKSVPLPAAPQRIAVISAAGAAGYGDFTDQLASAGYAFYPLLFQANMQGDRTVPTILHALDLIEVTEDFWDCVVIIRGGGATSDLNSFDNLQLARRVATFPLPIIVGIGHERDNTVLDYIANTRCKTPTAVAAFLNDRL
ncbi:MAG: exodeoxyribonuclease VII large subunit, partial [Muribaculaceae bacterium]|nr:exodeoxyribonuclease VII large subunit [Muribaculaceae bacterium]